MEFFADPIAFITGSAVSSGSTIKLCVTLAPDLF
jgi:hypothetical protein